MDVLSKRKCKRILGHADKAKNQKRERKNQGHANARDAKGLDMIAAIVQLRRAETAYKFLLVFKHLAFVFQNFQTAYN